MSRTYPVEGNVTDVQHGDNPGVVLGCDPPFLAHAGRVRISDIPTVNIGDEVQYSESLRTG